MDPNTMPEPTEEFIEDHGGETIEEEAEAEEEEEVALPISAQETIREFSHKA